MHLKVILHFGIGHKPQVKLTKTTKQCIKNSYITMSSPIRNVYYKMYGRFQSILPSNVYDGTSLAPEFVKDEVVSGRVFLFSIH